MEWEEILNFINITLLTLKVGVLSCLIIGVPGIFCGLLLSRGRFPGKTVFETLILLPMVLPPVAVGLGLLYVLASDGLVGAPLHKLFNLSLLLSWRGAVVASAVMAFPLLVKAAQQAFDEVPKDLENVARTLGKRRSQVFWTVTLPLAKGGIIQGMLLAFARAMGEFGATSLVAGLIPQQTETLALGIYDRILGGKDQDAWILSGVAVILSFTVLMARQAFATPRWARGGEK